MAEFEQAIVEVLEEEGDCHGRAAKGDPDGATRWGITQHTLDRARELHPELNLPACVADLARDQAKLVYRVLWWDQQPYAPIADQRLATKVLSADVNMGPTAIRLMQEALNHVVDAHLPGTVLFGPATLAALNRANPTAFLVELGDLMAEHYRDWIAKDPHPPERERMRKGLMARAAWPYPARAALVA